MSLKFAVWKNNNSEEPYSTVLAENTAVTLDEFLLNIFLNLISWLRNVFSSLRIIYKTLLVLISKETYKNLKQYTSTIMLHILLEENSSEYY